MTTQCPDWIAPGHGDSNDTVVPRAGIDRLVISQEVAAALRDLVGLEKARRTLVGEWGFRDLGDTGMGVSALFHGASGTGKSLAAEAIAYELGQAVKRVSAARITSMFVGESAKNVEGLFAEARANDAVLLFDEADALFATRTGVNNSTDRYANLDVSILLHQIEQFAGVVILTTNLDVNIDPAFRRRLRFIVEFPHPDATARTALWRAHMPKEMPVAADVSAEDLARDYPRLNGGSIRNAILRAASRAALRPDHQRVVRMADVQAAAREEERCSGAPKVVGFGATER